MEEEEEKKKKKKKEKKMKRKRDRNRRREEETEDDEGQRRGRTTEGRGGGGEEEGVSNLRSMSSFSLPRKWYSTMYASRSFFLVFCQHTTHTAHTHSLGLVRSLLATHNTDDNND